MNRFQKIIGALGILMILAPTLISSLKIETAHAVVPGVPIVNTFDLPRTFEWGLKEALMAALNALKKRILDMLVDQTINWVSGGGKPQFVTDWKNFAETAAQQAAGDFVKELDAGFLCKPFSLNVRLALLPVKKFNQRADCTLDDIVRNIDDFYNNFQTGGWIAYSRSWEPQNNFLGAYLMASDQRLMRATQAANAAVNEAVAGAGFLSTKKCQKDINGKDIPNTCIVTTPAKTLGDTLSHAIGATQDSIVSADDISEYVGAIANAAINRLILAGVGGLTGIQQTPPAATEGARISSSDQCGDLSPEATKECLNYAQSRGQSFEFSRDGFIAQIDLTLNPRLEAQRSITANISQLNVYLEKSRSIENNLDKLSVLICKSDLGETFSRKESLDTLRESIKSEQINFENLSLEATGSQSVNAHLQNAKKDITDLKSGDWQNQLSIFKSVEPSLNSSEAENYKNSKATEYQQTLTRTTDNLRKYEQRLTLCQKS